MNKFAELRLFGRALHDSVKNTQDSIAIKSEYVRQCANKGYVVHPECDWGRVMSYMQTLPNNINTTFYKSFNDVMDRTEWELLCDQLAHYASTYGTGHTGKAYVPNDNPAEINFTECKIIEPITLDELTSKIQDMLYSGIALKNDTLNDIFELILEFDLEIDLFEVKNREFLIRYHIAKGIPFDTAQETLQAINFIITDQVGIVKDRNTINAYRCFGEYNGKDYEYVKECFNSHTKYEWAAIFNRYKPLFLALRKDELKPLINKISKLSKKHHEPAVMPLSTKFLTPEYLNDRELCLDSIDYIHRNHKDLSLFQLVKYYNAVQKRIKGEFIDTINIRNGKSWIKKSSWDINQDVLKTAEGAIHRAIRSKMADKLDNKNLNINPDLNIVLPTSEKNFIGTLPIGSYVDVKPEDNLIVGIYWKGEDGARDLDLSFTDMDGKTVSWCNSYTDEGNNIVYSGDMTSAEPEAAEYLLFRNNMPNGVFMCNSYCAAPESKYTFIVARLPEGKSFERNHMVNPDDIIFQTPLVTTGGQMSMAVYVNGRFIFTDRAIGNSRVNRGDVTTTDLIQSQIDMADMSLTLNDFEDYTYRHGETVDLTTDDKSTLISLLA